MGKYSVVPYVGTTPTVKEKEGDVCNGEGEVCKKEQCAKRKN